MCRRTSWRYKSWDKGGEWAFEKVHILLYEVWEAKYMWPNLAGHLRICQRVDVEMGCNMRCETSNVDNLCVYSVLLEIQRQMDINKVRTLAVNNSRWIALKYRVCFLSHDAKWMLKEAHFFNSEFWCCLCRILVINGHDWISDWLVLYFFVIIAKFGFFYFLICFDRIDPIDISSQIGQYPIW